MFKKKMVNLLVITGVVSVSIGYATLQPKAAEPMEVPKVEVQKSTEDMVAKVKSILSNYDFAALTAEDAKAIHEAFRDAGFKSGKEQEAAIKEAGYDPKTLRELDPPPARKEANQKRKERKI